MISLSNNSVFGVYCSLDEMNCTNGENTFRKSLLVVLHSVVHMRKTVSDTANSVLEKNDSLLDLPLSFYPVRVNKMQQNG